MKKILIACCVAALLAVSCSKRGPEYDICVYGGTSAGVIAAYSARMMDKKVLLIEPGGRLGGLTSGGLGYTDIGNKQVVTGLSKDFYRRLGRHYGKLEQWIFEPGVAEGIFEDYVSSAGVKVWKKRRIVGAEVGGGKIVSIRVEPSDGEGEARTVTASMFIDCSYEGDLMAHSGVTYAVGREPNSLYDETYNGVQLMTRHQFPDGVDPYVVPGDSTSGLLWGISDAELLPDGSGDTLVQAYNYRICLTDDPDNMIPITRPDNYDSTRYELLLRLFEAQPDKRRLNDYFIWSRMPNRKTDVNNRGGFSTDAIGMNHNYPEAGYEERERIIRNHREYTQGLLYFYGHDSRVPDTLRRQMLRWGYPKDEYEEYGHWTPQLYVREVRRMVGEYVMTQANCENREVVEDGIGMAAYTMDSHNCQRIVVEKDGVKMVKNEGNVEIGGGRPYPISYRSIIPRRGECDNLLVPVCMSASHIAYGSIRMEPVFMVLAQSAAVAACLALETGDVHKVDVARVQTLLRENPLLDGSLPDVLADDSEAVVPDGGWEQLRRNGGYGPTFYVCNEGGKSIRFPLSVPEEGEYRLYTYYQLTDGTVPVTEYVVFDGKEPHAVSVDRADVVIEGQTHGEWIPLGTFRFAPGTESYVEVSGDPSAGRVVADAMLLIAGE